MNNINAAHILTSRRLAGLLACIAIGLYLAALPTHAQEAGTAPRAEVLYTEGSFTLPIHALKRRITLEFWIAAMTFVLMLVLIAMDTFHNTLAALTGTAIVFVSSYLGAAVDPDLFIFDFERSLTYIDWEVVFLIMGMMIVIAVVEGSGHFPVVGLFCVPGVPGPAACPRRRADDHHGCCVGFLRQHHDDVADDAHHDPDCAGAGDGPAAAADAGSDGVQRRWHRDLDRDPDQHPHRFVRRHFFCLVSRQPDPRRADVDGGAGDLRAGGLPAFVPL